MVRSRRANFRMVELNADVETLRQRSFSSESKMQRAAVCALHRVAMLPFVLIAGNVVIDVVGGRRAPVALKCHKYRPYMLETQRRAKLAADVADVVLLVELNRVLIPTIAHLGKIWHRMVVDKLDTIVGHHVETLEPEPDERPDFDRQITATIRELDAPFQFDHLGINPSLR